MSFNPSPDQQAEQVRQLKLCAAQYVWPRRKQNTPFSIKELQSGSPRYALVKTWKKWWEEKFEDDYDEYIKRNGIG